MGDQGWPGGTRGDQEEEKEEKEEKEENEEKDKEEEKDEKDYWPSIINYQLPPPHIVLYWPSAQLHHLVINAQLSQLDLVLVDFWREVAVSLWEACTYSPKTES